ncbi:MAG: hypothetical protein H6711_35230, partial [Myxococcales bacterium]|nr:hypothetical protein [Myxococcales bacterium]
MDRRGASTAGPRDPALRRRRSIVVALITVGLAACGGHRGEVEASPEPDPPTSSPPAASPEAEEADAALAAADAPAPAPAREEGPPGEAPTYPRPADWPDELPWIDTVRPDYTRVERSP